MHYDAIIMSMMPFNHVILCRLLLLPSIFPRIRVISNETALHIRWPKYGSFSFSFSISPSNEYSGLISFKIDWFDHLAVQGTLKSLLQHCNSKPPILQHSVIFMTYMTTVHITSVHDYWKTIALTIRTFVGKVMSIFYQGYSFSSSQVWM